MSHTVNSQPRAPYADAQWYLLRHYVTPEHATKQQPLMPLE